MIIQLLLLAGLIKVSLSTRSPWVPTGIYVAVSFLLALAFGYPFLALLIAAVINTGLAFLYFWLLKKTEDSGLWWGIMLGGIFCVAFVPFLLRSL